MRKDCPSCSRTYSYDLMECTYCRVPLAEKASEEGRIVAVTMVNAPSIGHEDVPYWTALVESDEGVAEIIKFDTEVWVGDTVPMSGGAVVHLEAVGIVGTGVMGRGLVELFLARGHHVVWFGRNPERLEKARARALDRLARVMDEDQLAEAEARLLATTEYAGLGDCDVVIEAVAEDLPTKLEVLSKVEAVMRDNAVLATNTSGIPLDDLTGVLKRPQRFGGLHFFNPANRMRLVETSLAADTDESTSVFLDEFALSLGKTPVRVASKPAFVVNRCLMPLLNEAVRTLEEDVAPAESIDEAVRLGLNHPMGPLALADLIGLDVVVEIMDNLAERTGDETYEPRPTLRRLLVQGKLGRKTGEGFYTYDG